MKAVELARELGVKPPELIAYFRAEKIPVPNGAKPIGAGVVHRVRARLEQERRRTGASYATVVRSAIEAAGPVTTRRRRKPRRRRVETQAKAEEAPVAAVVVPTAEDEGDPGASSVSATAAEREQPGADAPTGVPPRLSQETETIPGPDPSRQETVLPSTTLIVPPPTQPDLGRRQVASSPDLDDAGVGRAAASATSDRPSPGPLSESIRPSSTAGPPSGAELAVASRPLSVLGTPISSPRQQPRKPTPAATAGPGGQVRIDAEGYTSDGRRKKRGRGRGRGRGANQAEVRRNVDRIRRQLRHGGRRRTRRRVRLTPDEIEAQQRQEAQELELKERERTTIRVAEFLSVAELAELIEETPTDLVGSAFRNLGLLVTINQRLDFDQIEMLLDEFNFTAVREESVEVEEETDPYGMDSETARPRPPVVTVMGHVDHGKTLLLDRIRDANVVAGEAGGITQHIGAYHVALPGGRMTFLDTPGHAAFTAMRARGAEATDIVILLVAADDSVMPQTVEAINHATSAGVPMVVAVNKCDLPGVDPAKVKRELLQHSVQVDDFGGDVLSANISAKTGEGIDDLMEQILLQAELMEDRLLADPKRPAAGTVVEARLSVGKGPVVTVLVQGGTLRVGDTFVCGLHQGRVRALLDERGKAVKEAGPSAPVQVLGAGGVPQAGDSLQVMEPARAQAAVQERQQLEREKQMRLRERAKKIGDFGQLAKTGEVVALRLVIKGDVDGSVQALSDSLEQLGSADEGVEVNIVHRGVGAINESDVLLAQTTDAVILGFGVRAQAAARLQAEQAAVEIRLYDIIYKAVDDIGRALEGRLAPDRVETVEGTAEVREVFRISKVGAIAGCYVAHGRVGRSSRARVVREGVVVYDGEVGSLKRFKDDVLEVREGYECGIGIANFNDVKTGDEIECYSVEEIARKLAKVG